MNVTCLREKLRGAVVSADRVTGKNLSLPVLGSLLLTAEGDRLKVRATNLDIGIEITIPARVDEGGSIAVPGGVIANILSTIRDENVSLKTEGGNVQIVSEQSKTTINGTPHEDFPTLPVVENESSFSVSSQALLSGLRSVWYSAAVSDIKPEIASVYMYSEGEELVFVATDSFRLAEKRVRFDGGEIKPMLIPVRNVSEIVRVLEGSDEEVTVVSTANQMSLSLPSVYITSRVVDGVFPDYKQIIPKEHSTEAVLLKDDFSHSLKLTNVFADKFNQVAFRVDPSQKAFEIGAENADVGAGVMRPDTTLTGEAITMAFNQKYLVDCLQSIPTDSLALRMSGEGKPLVIRGVGDQSFLYLVMPLNQ